MLAILEPIAAVIRVGENCRRFGDPYEWSCTVVMLPTREAFLAGVDRPVTRAIWVSIERVLHAHGVKYAFWERRKAGAPTRVIRRKIRGDG